MTTLRSLNKSIILDNDLKIKDANIKTKKVLLIIKMKDINMKMNEEVIAILFNYNVD